MKLSALARHWADAPENPITQIARARRARGERVWDLVSPPPRESGLLFPQDKLTSIAAEAMRTERVQCYQPDSLGWLEAREAIAKHLNERGREVSPDRLVLTPGTSLGYLYAFRALMDHGDEVLIPSPGYPLFEDIAALSGIGLRRYHLRQTEAGWRPDIEEIEFQCTAKTKAIVVISPHNPTGTVWSEGDLVNLRALCEAKKIAVIFDEVFWAFTHPAQAAVPFPEGFPLVIGLNGFSKMLQLPGWKVGWMEIHGEGAELMRALEHLSDTFLPVGEFQQATIPALLREGEDFTRAMAGEIHRRMRVLHEALGLSTPLPDGGTYLCVPLPEGVSDDQVVLSLLTDHGLLVHPGHWYELPHHLVMTCLPPEEWLREGGVLISRVTGA